MLIQKTSRITASFWLNLLFLFALGITACKSQAPPPPASAPTPAVSVSDSPPQSPVAAASPTEPAIALQKQLREANDHFTYEGNPISVGVLKAFGLDDLSGEKLPAAAVVLEEATDERYEIKSEGGNPRKGIRAEYGEASFNGQESLGYVYLGRLANGSHVLLTTYSGGGSGIFTNLLLVNFTIHTQYTDEGRQDRILVMDAGQITLGDRYDGKIKVEPKSITIGGGRNHEGQQVIRVE